jgi:hypothetical protein
MPAPSLTVRHVKGFAYAPALLIPSILPTYPVEILYSTLIGWKSVVAGPLRVLLVPRPPLSLGAACRHVAAARLHQHMGSKRVIAGSV